MDYVMLKPYRCKPTLPVRSVVWCKAGSKTGATRNVCLGYGCKGSTVIHVFSEDVGNKDLSAEELDTEKAEMRLLKCIDLSQAVNLNGDAATLRRDDEGDTTVVDVHILGPASRLHSDGLSKRNDCTRHGLLSSWTSVTGTMSVTNADVTQQRVLAVPPGTIKIAVYFHTSAVQFFQIDLNQQKSVIPIVLPRKGPGIGI